MQAPQEAAALFPLAFCQATVIPLRAVMLSSILGLGLVIQGCCRGTPPRDHLNPGEKKEKGKTLNVPDPPAHGKRSGPAFNKAQSNR